MKDGLYQVTTNYLCAGFVMQKGKVFSCAPILRNRFNYWKTIAKEVKEMSDITGEFKCWTIKCSACRRELIISDAIDGKLDESFICFCPLCGKELN